MFCLTLELSRQSCSCPLASNTLEMPPIGCLPGLLGVSSTSATVVSSGPGGSASHLRGAFSSRLHFSRSAPLYGSSFSILNRGRCLLARKLMCYWNFSPVYIFLCVGKLGITSSFSESFPVSCRRNKRKLQLSCASESGHWALFI